MIVFQAVALLATLVGVGVTLYGTFWLLRAFWRWLGERPFDR